MDLRFQILLCQASLESLKAYLMPFQELKQMATEFDKSMNTMFGSYSRTKERKKANRRAAPHQGLEFPFAAEKTNLLRVSTQR